MKRLYKLILLIAAAFGFGVVGAAAQGLKQQIVGTWTVQSVMNEIGGKRVENFGPHPLGYWVFTPDGHFTVTIVRPGLPKFASNNRMKGTAQENQTIMRGSFFGFGAYTVNEADHSLTGHILGSSFPNRTGANPKAIIEISGDQLIWTDRGAPGGGTSTVILKRIE